MALVFPARHRDSWDVPAPLIDWLITCEMISFPRRLHNSFSASAAASAR
jgi:hypothetical protein